MWQQGPQQLLLFWGGGQEEVCTEAEANTMSSYFPIEASFHAGSASSKSRRALCAYCTAARSRTLVAARASRRAWARSNSSSSWVPGRLSLHTAPLNRNVFPKVGWYTVYLPGDDIFITKYDKTSKTFFWQGDPHAHVRCSSSHNFGNIYGIRI